MEHCAAHSEYQSSCPACITAAKEAKTKVVKVATPEEAVIDPMDPPTPPIGK